MNITDLKTSADRKEVGREMYQLISELYPICRSITGNGFRQTMEILKRFIPTKPTSSDEKLYQNDTKLDAGGLKLIDAAWLTQQYTEKKLRSAYMKLYAACI